MGQRPKRRKHKDNPYVLKYCKETNEYSVVFKDGNGVLRTITISKEIYETFNSFELRDLSQLNEFDRHIEHSELFEESLHNRAINKSINLEDFIIQKASFEELKKVINELPEIQKRRIKLYYFDDKTLEEIAVIEGCSKVAVKYSLDNAKAVLKEKLKNLQN